LGRRRGLICPKLAYYLQFSRLSATRAKGRAFQGQTRKEAYTKALGQGVSRRWMQFTVFLKSDAAAEASPEGPLTLCALEAGSGYVAAVAAQGAGWLLIWRQW
jgi:phosphopantetheinyl transferase